MDAITNYQQQRVDGFGVAGGKSNEADGKCISFVTSDLLPGQALHDIYENRCSKIVFARRLLGLDCFIWIINQSDTPIVVYVLGR